MVNFLRRKLSLGWWIGKCGRGVKAFSLLGGRDRPDWGGVRAFPRGKRGVPACLLALLAVGKGLELLLLLEDQVIFPCFLFTKF